MHPIKNIKNLIFHFHLENCFIEIHLMYTNISMCAQTGTNMQLPFFLMKFKKKKKKVQGTEVRNMLLLALTKL